MSNENRTIYLNSLEPVSIEIENGAILQFSLSKPLPKKLTLIIQPTDTSSTLHSPEVEPDGTIR